MKWFLFLFSCSAFAGIPENWTVELHAHLFMKEGMTWAFRGDFNGPLRAETYRDKFSSQANPKSLEKSENGIVVAALYAHQLMTFSLRDSIRRQVRLAQSFVASHPNWIIAKSALEARAALEESKHVMILSLEGASGIIDNDEDIAEFIDQDGIRIVNLLHLTDDEFGGVAFLRGFNKISSPVALLASLFHPVSHEDVSVNNRGLTSLGQEMARKLIAHHVWLDLAHASDHSIEDLVPLILAAGEPLLYTHTMLRSYHHAERGISREQLLAVAKSRGIVGAMPSEDMLSGTNAVLPCPGGFADLVKQYNEYAAVLGSDSVMLGSDYNGGVEHLKPTCETRTSLDRDGFYNIGQSAELWKAMRGAGARVPVPLREMVSGFLRAWERVSAADAKPGS